MTYQLHANLIVHAPASAKAPEVVWINQHSRQGSPAQTLILRGKEEIDAVLGDNLATYMREKAPFSRNKRTAKVSNRFRSLPCMGTGRIFNVPEGFLRDEVSEPMLNAAGEVVETKTVRYQKTAAPAQIALSETGEIVNATPEALSAPADASAVANELASLAS